MDKCWCMMVAILYSLTWLAQGQGDCVYKECFCAQTIIMCGGHNLQEMPHLVNTSVTGYLSLQMENNQIQSIPSGSFPNNIQDITFSNNPVSNIADGAFDNCATSLRTIYFSNTQLTGIPNAFGNLHSLIYLQISGANIVDWNEEAMKSLGPTMQTLYLENVGMTAWPTWIQYFDSLTELTLAGGSIQSIPDDAFDAVASNLTNLSLSNNSLTVVPKALSKLTNLEALYLGENNIYDVSWLPHACTLSSLSINNNNISDAVMLSNALRPLGNCLMFLDINVNQLTVIPDFSFLTNVTSLDFTYNKISDSVSGAAFVNLTSLDLANNYLRTVPKILVTLLKVTDVYLSYNFLQSVQSTDFHLLTSYADLGNNLLTELTDTSFPANSAIMYLQLNNNPLAHISAVALKNLPSLRELNLRSTKITRLPVGLSSLTLLSQIDVSMCSYLVCTCMEAGLTNWFKQFREVNVVGDCGQTSVYNFFTFFSPSCPT